MVAFEFTRYCPPCAVWFREPTCWSCGRQGIEAFQPIINNGNEVRPMLVSELAYAPQDPTDQYLLAPFREAAGL